jgi:hypothetical protein
MHFWTGQLISFLTDDAVSRCVYVRQHPIRIYQGTKAPKGPISGLIPYVVPLSTSALHCD